MMKTWFNVSEAADYAGVSRDTIYTACERHELRSARLSGRRAIRIRPQWIDSDQTSVDRRLAGAARGRRRAALEREHAVRSRVMSGVSNPNGAIDSTRRTTALTERQVAEQLGLSVATLRAWRHRGKGPRFLRLGRSVRYLPSDVDEFVRASAVDTQSDSSSDDDSELGELHV